MAAEVSNVSLPDSIVYAAQVQARLSGVSLEQWISLAVASRLDTDEGASAFFRRRAEGATGTALEEWLDSRPDVPPVPGDEI